MELGKLEERYRAELKRRCLIDLLEVQDLQKKHSELGSVRFSEPIKIESD
ncbi:hypothetical protein R5R35_001066 [Gryllus longicercus]|uniref:Uncharacterized protein n=1 Tax=Gryllus longicercus TaxID=2509291 RepID=A0AAN9ZEH6_9ORTH